MTPTPGDALAHLPETRHYDHRNRTRRTLKLDDGRSLQFPGPRLLAETFVLPLLEETREVYRTRDGLVARPLGGAAPPVDLPLAALQAEIRDALAALPDRLDAGRSYRDLVDLIRWGNPATAGAYLADVARSTKTLLAGRTWRPPRAPRPAAEHVTPAEREARRRRDERASTGADARHVLGRWLPTLSPGRHTFASVWEAWLAAVDRPSVEKRYPGAVLIGRTAFYALLSDLASDAGHAVATHAHIRHLVIPKEIPMTPSEIHALADDLERADRAAGSLHAKLVGLADLERRSGRPVPGDVLAATGTDGAPADLAAYRSARR